MFSGKTAGRRQRNDNGLLPHYRRDATSSSAKLGRHRFLLCRLMKTCDTRFRFNLIEEADVLKLLMALDPNKAIGADRISGKLLHMTACGISWSLTSLFNSSLKCGDLPSEWKAALVTRVQKNGSSDLVENFRPISVLPVVVKVLEDLCTGSCTPTCRKTTCYTPLSLVLDRVIPPKMFW